jgi:8-oxo-dGTP pyrophosphatase MutT (NUDIX family)
MSVDIGKIHGCGVMPIGWVGGKNGRVMFLLGREQRFDGWSGSGKYADFGGGIEKGENVLDCAAREGYEESMGFFGGLDELRRKVTPGDRDFVDAFVAPGRSEHMVFAVKMYYNKYLPKTFEDVFKYIVKCADKLPQGKYVVKGCPEGFIEKDEIRWFGFTELHEMVKKGDDRLRPYFVRCLEVMFNKYPTEKDLMAKMR